MLRILLILAGYAHLLLVPIGLAVPVVLGWRKELESLRPFLRRLFWTYGGFIMLANIGFGIITLVGIDDLVRGTALGIAFSVFLCLYWIARLVVQYGYFPWSDFPSGPIHTAARHLLDLLFVYMAVVYGWAALASFLP